MRQPAIEMFQRELGRLLLGDAMFWERCAY
jgi:hypothetical protein